MVNGAQRFDAPLAAGHNNIGGRGVLDKSVQVFHIQPGHVAGHNQASLRHRCAERRDQAAEGPIAGCFILHHRPAEVRVAFPQAHQRRGTRRAGDHLRHMNHQRNIAERQQRLVAPHPLAVSAAQNEPLALAPAHLKIIPSCYNLLIRITLSRFTILAGLVSCYALTAWAGDLARPTAAPRVKSVVRLDPKTGRLLRSTFALPDRPALARAVLPISSIPVPASPVTVQAIEPQILEPRSISASGLVAPLRPLPKMPLASERIREIIEEKSKLHGLDPLLVHSVIRAESNYNPYAISPKGAEGLMQLIPATARQYGVRNSFDPEQNIEGGIRYLKYLQSLFSDERLVLAAYNAGEGAVAKYGWIPPYAETQDYVYKVGRYYGLARRQQTQAATVQPLVKTTPPPPVLQEFVDGEGRIHITLRQVNE